MLGDIRKHLRLTPMTAAGIALCAGIIVATREMAILGERDESPLRVTLAEVTATHRDDGAIAVSEDLTYEGANPRYGILREIQALHL